MYTLSKMATIQKKTSRGHTYWQIVESRRVNGKPRPIVLLHLGTAERLLERLQHGMGKPLTARVFEFGASAALWKMAEELDVVGTIDRHLPKRQQGLSCGQYLLLAALNRCVAPRSKASLYDWYRTSVLARLLPVSQRLLRSQRFWDHMAYCQEDTLAAIEEELTARLVEQFQVDLKTLLFDATNFDTFIATPTAATLPQRGHAKSKRKDLRIVGLALLVSTDFHIPLFSHLYAGNQNDATMFASVVERLVARYHLVAQDGQDITLVFDGGNTSAAAIADLDTSPYHFITSLTLTHHPDLLAVPLRQFQAFSVARLKGTTAFHTKKVVWGKERTVVITRSEELLAGQLAGIATALRKKRAALTQLRAKLHRSQHPPARGKGYTRESLEKQLKAITAGQYIAELLKPTITAPQDKLDFSFATDFTAFDRLKRTRLGKRILCTDQHQWATQDIIVGSRAQSHVEDAFRQMKDPHWVSFSPAFHWTDQKLRVHAFYCVLALTLCTLLQRKAAQAGLALSLPVLLEHLSDIKEVVNLYPPNDSSSKGRLRAEYLLSHLSPVQHKLCRIFDLAPLAHSTAP